MLLALCVVIDICKLVDDGVGFEVDVGCGAGASVRQSVSKSSTGCLAAPPRGHERSPPSRKWEA